MTGHDYAIYAAIGGIVGLTALAMWLGVADGSLQGAIAALLGLGGYKVVKDAVAEGRNSG